MVGRAGAKYGHFVEVRGHAVQTAEDLVGTLTNYTELPPCSMKSQSDSSVRVQTAISETSSLFAVMCYENNSKPHGAKSVSLPQHFVHTRNAQSTEVADLDVARGAGGNTNAAARERRSAILYEAISRVLVEDGICVLPEK